MAIAMFFFLLSKRFPTLPQDGLELFLHERRGDGFRNKIRPREKM